MAVTLTNSAEGGTNGTTVSTGNSGGGSGNAFDVVTIGAGAGLIYDSTHVAHGSLALKFTEPASSVSVVVQWTTSLTGSSVTTVYFRAYCFFTANPPATIRLIEALSGGAFCGGIAINTSGKLLLLNAAGTILVTSTAAIPTGAMFRIEGFVTGSATVGQISVSLYDTMDSTSATESDSTTAAQNTTGTINGIRFGSPTNGTSFSFWLDDLGASDTALLGPVTQSVSGADTGTGADSAGSVGVSAADAGSGTDTAAVTAAVPGADTGTGADSGAIGVSGADTGAGTDTAALRVAAADTGSGTDTASLAASLTAADTGTGADTAAVTASLSAADAASGADLALVGVSAADAASGADTASVVIINPPAVFPQAPIDLRAELLLGTNWTDISTYLYQRNPPAVTITRGHPDETTTTNPTDLKAVIDNRGGTFSDKNPNGPYYGLIGRNTPARFSVPEGASYLRIESDQSSYASCPDAAGLDITGDTEIQIDVTLDNWYANQSLAGKWNSSGSANQRTWLLLLNEDRTLTFWWSLTGSFDYGAQSTAPVPVPALRRQAIRVTLAVASGTATFYTAQPAAGQVALGSILATSPSWTQLGAAVTVATGAGALFDSTANPCVGFAPSATGDFPSYAGIYGKVHAFSLLSGIGGTIEASPDFTVATPGAPAVTDGQGNVWSLSGTSEISSRAYRAHVEMAAWPQSWDPTGADVWMPVTGSGLLRRLAQNNRPLMSPMYRYWTKLTGTGAPVAYWPGEDGQNSTQFASGLSGQSPMSIAGQAILSGNSAFACSASLPVTNGSTWYGPVAPYASGADAQFTFLLDVPAAGDQNDAVIATMTTNGTVAYLVIVYTSTTGGTLSLLGYDQNWNPLISISSINAIGGVNGQPMAVSMALLQSGSDITWHIASLNVNSTVTQSQAGTQTSATVGQVTQVLANPGEGTFGTAILMTTAMGHFAVQSTFQDLSDIASPLAAWGGEAAATRFARLCAEEGLACRIVGCADTSVPMGPQGISTLTSLLQEVPDADRGIMFEPRQQLALGYRTSASLLNQQPAAALTYTMAQLAANPGMAPTEDDQFTVNDVTVSGGTGGSGSATSTSPTGKLSSSARQFLASGPLSVQPPPDGVGTYDTSVTCNVANDRWLQHEAGWIVHTGTVWEPRYPVIPVNMARTQVAGVFYDLPQTDIGDRITVASTPVWLPPDGISQLMQGTEERLGGFVFEIDWNGIPETPYETAVAALAHADTAGSQLSVGASSTATTLTVATTAGPLWTTNGADFPFDIELGGERITVTAIGAASASPPSAAFLNPPAMYETAIANAVADWQAWTGTTMTVARRYYAISSFPVSDSTLAYYAANGIKCCLNLCPAFNPVSATDRTSLAAMLAYWAGQGLDMEVSLWGEPFNNGLSAAQFIAMFRYYGPTVRAAGVPVVFCTSVATVASNNENSYYPGDSYVDIVATDFYGLRRVQGDTLDLAASVANAASPPKPFAVWEYSTSPGTQFLTGDTAAFDSTVGTWTGAGNASVTHVGSPLHSGTGAGAITSLAPGSMAAGSFAAGSITSQGLPCSAGDTISGRAWVLAATAARVVNIGAVFYNSGGGVLATIYDTADGITNSTSGWLLATGTVTAPSSSAFCRLQVQVVSTGGTGEIHYLDDAYLADTTTNGITTAQAEGFLAYLESYMTGRIAAGLPVADSAMIFFNSGVPTPSLNDPVASSTDFRLPSLLALYAGIYGTSLQQFTVIRSVNGVVKAQAPGTAIALFDTPILALA